jgi:tRNA modification GTPase
VNANDGSVIVATGTAPGRGGRILVRCSGEGLLAYADDLLSGRGLDAARRRERGCFVDTLSIPSPALTRLDADPDALHGAGSLPCIVAVLPGPTTFTGEDVLEVEIPGNPALGTIVNRVLIAHFDRRTGHARAAGPGEFSARAFLAGRLSIQDATGIAASIAAARDEDLDAADRQRRGPVAAEVRAIGDRLADAIARTEAGIDFSDEEDVVGCSTGELRNLLDEIRHGLDLTGQRIRAIRPAARDAPVVALVGPANAGKSTLFNRLVGHERVVVSEIAGTTRDAIEASVDLSIGDERRRIRLIDTAGFGRSQDSLRASADARTRATLEAADLVICCVPNDLAEGHERDRWERLPTSIGGVLHVRTKGDLPRSKAADAACLNPEEEWLEIALPSQGRSTGAEQGVESLVRRIVIQLDADGVGGESAATEAWRELQAAAVMQGASAVERVAAMIQGSRDADGPPMPEVVVAELLATLEAIRRLDGDVDPDEVLDLVFGRFCIGK